MKIQKIRISGIQPGSIAEELEIKAGDYLLSINRREIRDVFDYRFMTSDDFLTLEIEGCDGVRWTAEIEKDEDEDLGLEFENPLMDEEKAAGTSAFSASSTSFHPACANHCITRMTISACVFCSATTSP